MNDVQTIFVDGEAWTLASLLSDEGGYGNVWMGVSNGKRAAIKLVEKIAGARREWLLANELRGLPNIIPVLGVAEVDNRFGLLMPLAEKSLRQYIAEIGPALPEDEVRAILIDITRALAGMESRGVVHRDIKPENILLHNGSWCLADFGVSRYANAATATATRRDSFTGAYAAPEQWRRETATSATDVYALGVVGHELAAGERPFRGRKEEELRNQHLRAAPSKLVDVTPSLAALIEACLFKLPDGRPDAQTILNRLESPPESRRLLGVARLEAASLAEVRRLAVTKHLESEARLRRERRSNLGVIGEKQFERISSELKDALLRAAPRAKVSASGTTAGLFGWQLALGAAGIKLENCFKLKNEAPHFELQANLPVSILYRSSIAVGRPQTRDGYAGRAHTLWYCDAKERGRYGWYEIAFMHKREVDRVVNYLDLDSTKGIYLPHSLYPFERETHEALYSPSASSYIAWPFTPLRLEDLNEFIERWAIWFADAIERKLRRPTGSNIK